MSRPDYKKDFPKQLERARGDLTLKELGRLVGVSFQTIQRWEKGERTPERVSAQRLAEVLHDNLGEPWLDEFAREPTVKEIPVLAYVAGGRPIVEEIQDQKVSVDPGLVKMAGDVCALRVKGESMVEQHILDGDVLICRKVPQPKELRKGTIVVVDLKGERGASVKRWEFKSDTIYLYSDKYAKPEDKMSFHDWEVGKVFELLGLVRSLK